MISKLVKVEQTVKIIVDETKFTPEFIEEFKDTLYDYSDIDDHINHLAQLEAREIITGSPEQFLEGYGTVSDMGIEGEVIELETYIINHEPPA